MNTNSKIENNKPLILARYIKLKPEEYQTLLEDERLTGKSAQTLLKNAYFGKGRVVVLMSDDDKNTFLTQISRIGNNVNQIARKLNTGIAFGFDQEITNVRILLTQLMRMLTTKYHENRNEKEAL